MHDRKISPTNGPLRRPEQNENYVFSAEDRQAAEALDFMNGFYPFGWKWIQELFWRSAVPIQQRQFVKTLKNKTKYNSLALGLLFVPHPKIIIIALITLPVFYYYNHLCTYITIELSMLPPSRDPVPFHLDHVNLSVQIISLSQILAYHQDLSVLVLPVS